MNADENNNVRKAVNDGIASIKMSADYITLNAISVLSEKQLRNK